MAGLGPSRSAIRSCIACQICSAWFDRPFGPHRTFPRRRQRCFRRSRGTIRLAGALGGLPQGIGRRTMRRVSRLQEIERLGPPRRYLGRGGLQRGMLGLRRTAPCRKIGQPYAGISRAL